MPKPLTADDIEDLRGKLAHATDHIDGPDAPYNPWALAAARVAEALLAEVDRLRPVEPKIDQLHAQLRERRNDYVKSLSQIVQAAAQLDQERQVDIAALTARAEAAEA